MIWIAIAVLSVAFALFATIAVRELGPQASTSPRPAGLFISSDELTQIAVEEVKKREGWSGIASEPSLEGSSAFVFIKRKPGPSTDWRAMMIKATTGGIISYEVRTDPIP
jgi:hypothetical protein